MINLKTTIPFTKEILFKNKIAEITSISLEHELNTTENEISGNFIVSGDYKTHEVCVNKEEFLYKLPFSVEITENIDLDTLNFEITDFNYEIVGNDTLKVNIEFIVEADEKKIIEEPIEEEQDREELVTFEKAEPEVLETPLDDIIPPQEMTIETEETTNLNEDERLNEQEKNTILNAVDNEENEYMTYNVHIVREMETLESICETYNANIDMVTEYNNIETLNIGDKIIIPQEQDE